MFRIFGNFNIDIQDRGRSRVGPWAQAPKYVLRQLQLFVSPYFRTETMGPSLHPQNRLHIAVMYCTSYMYVSVINLFKQI